LPNGYYPSYPGYGGYPPGWGMQYQARYYPTYNPSTYPVYAPAMSPMYRPVAVAPRPAYYYPSASAAYPRPVAYPTAAYPRPAAYPTAPGIVPVGISPGRVAVAGPPAAGAVVSAVVPTLPPKAAAAPIAQQLPPPHEEIPVASVSSPFHLDFGPNQEPKSQRFWGSADYMMAWVRPGPLGVPLITTGLAQIAPGYHPGALGQPGTQVLFGNDPLNFPMNSGIRAQAGVFLDSQSCFSLDVGGFFLPTNHVHFSVSSDGSGNPLIARPLFFVVPPPGFTGPAEGEEIDAFNGFPIGLNTALVGGASVDATTRLFGAEANARYNFYSGKLHGSALAGFRNMQLDESLTISDAITPVNDLAGLTFLNTPVNTPNALAIQDQFRTSNRFYGLQVGSQLAWEDDWWYVSLTGKIAVGSNDEKMSINGSTTEYSPLGAIASTAGGYLALPSNIGNRERSEFSILPEAVFNLGLEPIRHVRIMLGYSILMLNNVVRPGTMIDRNVNPFTIPSSPDYGQGIGPASPTFIFHEQAFWMQALNVGLQFYY